MSDRLRDYDSEDWDEQDEPTFERVRKQIDKPQTMKAERHQKGREWGKMHNKYHKQRRRAGEYNKP